MLRNLSINKDYYVISRKILNEIKISLLNGLHAYKKIRSLYSITTVSVNN